MEVNILKLKKELFKNNNKHLKVVIFKKRTILKKTVEIFYETIKKTL